jgi:hypothetical protein
MDALLREAENRHPRDPLVKKIVAVLTPRGEKNVFDDACERLRAEWGEPERVSEAFPFIWTNYYEEIAPELDRYFISYPGLFPFSHIADWKKKSCEIESQTGASRRVNLDPGTIDGARLVLASTKGQAHRIYLRDGIFAEVTLCRRKGKWESFFYTFPDFKSGAYLKWLDLVRADWKREHYAIANGANIE